MITFFHWPLQRKTFGELLVIWLFLAASVVNIVATIGLTVERMAVVVRDDPNNPDFTFALLLIVNAGTDALGFNINIYMLPDKIFFK